MNDDTDRRLELLCFPKRELAKEIIRLEKRVKELEEEKQASWEKWLKEMEERWRKEDTSVSKIATQISKLRADLFERMILTFLEKHPELLLDDIEIVERKLNHEIAWYVRQRGSNEEPS
jgi:hypothetical protein